MQKIKPFYLSIKALLLSALVVIFLQGCGAKGDLYHTPELNDPEQTGSEKVEQDKSTNKEDVSEQQTK